MKGRGKKKKSRRDIFFTALMMISKVNANWNR